MEGGLEVHVQHRVEQLRGHVVERLVAQDAGVADDDVDAAERLQGGVDDGLAALDGGHGAGVGHRLPAQARDLLDRPLGRAGRGAGAVGGPAEVVDDHLGAAGGQQQGVLAAQAAARAGHDRHPAVEADLGHASPALLTPRRR